MSRQEVKGGVPVFGILLLYLGIVFLLQTLGVLPWGLWAKLWQFWPVLLIIMGLGMLFRHHKPWLVGLLILVLLLACLGIAIWQYGPVRPGGVRSPIDLTVVPALVLPR